MEKVFDLIPMYADVKLPAYKTEFSSGMDLHAYLPDGPIYVSGRYSPSYEETYDTIPTGLKIKFYNKDFEAQVRSRSGLAFRHGIFVLNEPGTIDSDYDGEIKVILGNIGNDSFEINNGDRIAQLIIAPVYRNLNYVDLVERGEGGFGSTGK